MKINKIFYVLVDVLCIYYEITSTVWPVKVDKPVLCWSVIQLTAALSLQPTVKVQNCYNFFLSKLHVKTYSRRPKPDSCQTHQHKTDRLTPDSRQTQSPPDPITSFAFLATDIFEIWGCHGIGSSDCSLYGLWHRAMLYVVTSVSE
jgi:hypothetical protein